MKGPTLLAMGKDSIIRKVIDKNTDMGNRFKECMALSTATSKRKNGTVMASWENPLINIAQYSDYGFNKSKVKTLKPKKSKEAPGPTPVIKAIRLQVSHKTTVWKETETSETN